MRRLKRLPLVLLIGSAGFAVAQAPDQHLGRGLAASCSNCHGTNGVSQGAVPSLAGAAKADFVTKMQEFKSGKRPGTIMPQLAKGYSDEQIEAVAAWFATQKP